VTGAPAGAAEAPAEPGGGRRGTTAEGSDAGAVPGDAKAAEGTSQAVPGDARAAEGTSQAGQGTSKGGQGTAKAGRSGPGGGWRGTRRRMWTFGPLAGEDERQRRRRRWFVIGIAVAAGIVVVALCAGGLSVLSSINGVRDRAADARQARQLRETDCLELERRLNRLAPPGAATGPRERATAVRDENAAVRIYLGQLHSRLEEDGWRQLLDARTVYADALDRQASTRTPAFYVAPRTSDGQSVAGELERWSPAPCAGPVRRLAAPEL
jgi:hypothetical protein